MAESAHIKADPVAYVRWRREQSDSWEKIAATGAFRDKDTGELLTGDQIWEWYEAQSSDIRRA
jgi:hypothetical protein